MRIAVLASTILLGTTLIAGQRLRAGDSAAQAVDRGNVVFDSPSKDFHGAMPLGNGQVGVSAWVEENGDMVFYISKTDAYDDNNRLLKLGRVRVRLTPNPVVAGGPYRQELKLGSGEFVVQAGKGDAAVTLRLWVDANQPVIRLEAEGKKPFDIRASLESWRTQQRQLAGQEISHSDPLNGSGQPTIQYPDAIFDGQKDRVVWYHHNAHSVWPITMKLQGLESLMQGTVDPLLDRTFGAAIAGEGMVNDGATSIKSAQPRQRQAIDIYVLTQHPAQPEQWLAALDKTVAQVAAIDWESARLAHRQGWRDFWNRSWIRLDGPPDALPTTRGYVLQRYLTVCGGRGDPWVKFNGSIFTLPYERDPDFRRWAGELVPEFPPALLADDRLGRLRRAATAVSHLPGQFAPGPTADADLLWPRRRTSFRKPATSGAPMPMPITDGTGTAFPSAWPRIRTSPTTGPAASRFPP